VECFWEPNETPTGEMATPYCQTVTVIWVDDNEALAYEAGETLHGGIEESDELHATRNTATSSVMRVQTNVRSAIVKFISSANSDQNGEGSDDPTHPRYWRREADFYEVGVPGPFAKASVQARKVAEGLPATRWCGALARRP
jgi:hypothetical protein